MSNTSSGSCQTNLKLGLIFVKSKIIDNAVCFSSLDETDVISSCKGHDKWIVVAGNSYNLNRENAPKCLLRSNNDEKGTQKNLVQDGFHSGVSGLNILYHPVLQANIVELHLDSVFKDKTSILPLELFKCVNVRVLSLRHNKLACLPADVGRLAQLRTLILTENSLTLDTIPFTLTFCTNLAELYLDNNLLDALPGFLLKMSKLETVYRHGNHNYFKSTFMWYHTAERQRVEPLRPNRATAVSEVFQPKSLEFHSIKALISARMNFFTPGLLPVTLQDYVAKVYTKFRICAYCNEAFHESKTGFRVFTFMDPYLGNTCVPFLHWTCSQKCSVAVEEPAHRWERIQASKLDEEYQQYIKNIQNDFSQKSPDKRLSSCVLM